MGSGDPAHGGQGHAIKAPHPLPVGTRVRVTKVYDDLASGQDGPKCRLGRIVKHKPECGGYLVRHDTLEDMGPFGMVDVFGWSYDEVVPVVVAVD